MAGVFGSLSRAVRQVNRQARSPVVNRRVSGPPAPRRRPQPVRQPRAFQVRPQGFQGAQRQAQRRVVRAQKKAPPEHRLPYVPVLKHYTPQERHYINRLVQQKGAQYARQTGQKPNQALTTLQQTGDPSTRSALQAYSKLYLEQRRVNDAKAFRNTYGHQAAQGMSVRQQALAFRQGNPRGQIKPGPKPQGGVGGYLAGASTAAADIGRTLSGGIHPVAGMSWARVGQSAGQIAGPGVRDALGLPANIIGTGYQVGRAGVGLATGNTKPASQLVQGIKNTDPIALALQGRFKEAGHQVVKHPLYAYLEAAGAKGAVGRSIGRPLRATGVLPKERVPASLPGTNITLKRPTSNDVFRLGRQQLQDRRNIGKADTLRTEATRVEPSAPDRAVELRQKANKVDPRIVSPREVSRRTTETFAANELVRSHNRDALVHAVTKNGVPKHGAQLVSLVAQNIVHSARDDVLAYRRELDLEHAHLGTKGKRAANRRLAASLDQALADPKLDMGAVGRAADEFANRAHPVNRQLVDSNMLPASQAEKARLIPYAVRRMGASHDGEQIVDAAGAPLSTQQIRAHMQAHGVTREPVYLPQGPSTRGAKNFFVNFAQRPAVGGPARTGEATRAGLLDTHPDTLAEGVARQQGLVDAERGFRRFVGEQGLHDPRSGDLVSTQSRREIDQIAREVTQSTGERFVPIRLEPFAARREQLDALLSDSSGHSFEGPQAVRDALAEAVGGPEGATPGPGPWGLVHEAAAKTFHEQNRVLGPGTAGKVAQVVNRQFRQTVLPLSVKWLTGNVVEAALRNTVARAGLLSYLKGRGTLKALDRIDPQLGAEARARAIGGGHYSGIKIPYRSAEQFSQSNAVIRGLAHAFGTAARAPGVKSALNLWRHYTHFVMESVNGRLEKGFQTALAGKHLIDQHGIGLSTRAMAQAARGLTNTSEQVAMGRFVDRAYGKYGKFSPSERYLISNFTPFVAWAINAANFVYRVLPRDHPVLVGMMASADRAYEEWRKSHGLDLFMKNHAPLWLQGSIPEGGGTFLRASRYTPFGAFSDPGGTIAQQVLPQYTGALNALQGRDWKGDQLKGSPTPDKLFATALLQFVESTVPVSGQVHRVVIGEGKAKQAPLSQRVKREFNPAYPVQQTQTASTGPPDKVSQAVDNALGKSKVDDSKLDSAIDNALKKKR